MSGVKENKEREHRIIDQVVVDAYDEQERAMGWYYYLEEKLKFPFVARCVAKRTISPLKKGDEVEVLSMAPEEECEYEMFVMMRWEKDGLAVPLSQLDVVGADDQTREAVKDWYYWVKRGYRF